MADKRLLLWTNRFVARKSSYPFEENEVPLIFDYQWPVQVSQLKGRPILRPHVLCTMLGKENQLISKKRWFMSLHSLLNTMEDIDWFYTLYYTPALMDAMDHHSKRRCCQTCPGNETTKATAGLTIPHDKALDCMIDREEASLCDRCTEWLIADKKGPFCHDCRRMECWSAYFNPECAHCTEWGDLGQQLEQLATLWSKKCSST